MGASDEDVPYQKGSALQTWLLGFEFPETLILVTEQKVIFYASEKKLRYIEAMKKGPIPLETVKRNKDESQNQAALAQLIDALSSSLDGKKIGVFTKDRYQGKLVAEWKDAVKKADKFQEVDISAGVAAVMVEKDDDEIKLLRQSAKLTSVIMKRYFLAEMMDVLDSGKKVKHEALSTSLENILDDEALRKKFKLPADVCKHARGVHRALSLTLEISGAI